jgi:hypothetical protein
MDEPLILSYSLQVPDRHERQSAASLARNGVNLDIDGLPEIAHRGSEPPLLTLGDADGICWLRLGVCLFVRSSPSTVLL